jgi:hypothetical protein
MELSLIVGYWNSGTTLLVDILRKHPDFKLGHSRFKANIEDREIAKMLQKVGYNLIRLGDYSEINENGFKGYVEPALNESEKKEFLNLFMGKYGLKSKTLLLKNPWLFYMPNFLQNVFSDFNTRKLIILRDGNSQIVSKDYWLRNTDDPEQKLYTRAKFWVRSMEYLFDNWIGREDTMILRYENLCSNPKSWISKICHFYNIDDAPLTKKLPEYYENRLGKLQSLDKKYFENMNAITLPMQEKIEKYFPVEK